MRKNIFTTLLQKNCVVLRLEGMQRRVTKYKKKTLKITVMGEIREIRIN